MLPILIYEPDRTLRSTLLESIGTFQSAAAAKVRISLSTDSPDSLRRAIEAEKGISLLLMGVCNGQIELCIELGEQLMRQSRDNYVVYCLHSPDLLDDLLNNCMRPAGILIAPWDVSRLLGCLNRVLKDYEDQIRSEAPGESLTIETNNTSYRVPYSRISYLEALDKMITLHTDQQSIIVRHSLSAMEGDLPAQFVRCHRAFIVNSTYIEKVNFTQMLLTLSTGEVLPVSRGHRATIRQAIERRGTNER